MTNVKLVSLTKTFGDITAVDNMYLEIRNKEFFILLGPTGAGKTTTLRLIAGLEKTTSGNIYIGDTLVNDVLPKDRDVAMVFQNYALYPHMTAYQNMAFALKMRKFPRTQINNRIEEAAKLLGIEHLLNRKPKALSGGQRQRVAVGRAIVRNPKAFLLDEPLSNLDAKLRLTTRAEIKGLHHRLQTTFIYVTHDQAEAMTLGERICVMNNGVIQQIADPMEVYQRPINRFVAGFLGTPPMNFFAGYLKLQNDTACLMLGNDTIMLPKPLKPLLKDYRDKEMVMGVRPENISPEHFPGQSNNMIWTTVDIIEPVGNRTDVYLSSQRGDKFIASTAPYTKLKANDTVQMYIDMENVHIFEPGETGKNVTLSKSKSV